MLIHHEGLTHIVTRITHDTRQHDVGDNFHWTLLYSTVNVLHSKLHVAVSPELLE